MDCIIEERRAGVIAGVEIKLTATPRQGDIRHLRTLRNRLGSHFACGVLLHGGTQALSFGDRLWALPILALVSR